jgi:hypothetical protein
MACLEVDDRRALRLFTQPEMKILDLSDDEKAHGVPATNWASV